MNKTVLVSIIIPTYNRASLLSETLESVLIQSYTNWECFVIDDGSTDNTSKIVNDFCEKDSRFKFFNRPESKPKGANACRNYGLELCSGNYILFYDSDDVMLKEKLQEHISMFKNTIDIDATVTNSSHYNFINKEAYLPWRERLTSNNLVSDFIALKAGWHTGDAMWRSETLKDLSFNETLACSQDWEFHLRAIITNKTFVFKDKCLSYIRHTAGSIKNSLNMDNVTGSFLARESILKMLIKHDKLNKENASLLLNDFYSYFELLAYNFRTKLSIRAVRHIIYLSFKCDNTGKVVSDLFFKYPVKILKRIFNI